MLGLRDLVVGDVLKAALKVVGIRRCYHAVLLFLNRNIMTMPTSGYLIAVLGQQGEKTEPLPFTPKV
ncbi:hypothetical protein MesoLj131b_06930 [Mesorhizobium sp. 131-2-5]|nr:hypothetical protein MesoLj131b_06930 [Mesorhizobium sp. 131-2-5]